MAQVVEIKLICWTEWRRSGPLTPFAGQKESTHFLHLMLLIRERMQIISWWCSFGEKWCTCKTVKHFPHLRLFQMLRIHTHSWGLYIRNVANEWSLWHPFPFRYHSLKEKTIKHLTNIHSHPINTKQTQNTIYFLFRLFIWWKKMNGFSLQICAIAFAFAGSRCDGGGGLGSGCGAGVWSPDDVVRNV